MPLYYNLTKIYAVSNKKANVIQSTVCTFVSEVKIVLKQTKKGIRNKEYSKVSKHISSVESSLDLFGLDSAYDNALRILEWSDRKGKKKEIRTTHKEFRIQVKKAIKELEKDFSLENLFLNL